MDSSGGLDTKELGNLGEKIACEYLVKKGYKILAKNYRISFGEIDIIAKKKFTLLNKISQILTFTFWQKLFNRVATNNNHDKTIHFVEVKTLLGSNESFAPEERVDYKKQRKLRQMSQIWLEKNKFNQRYPYQIDVIGILINENTKKAKLRYFPNAVEDV